jgi:hypothetical protein
MPARSILLTAATVAALATAPSAIAQTAPPANDNYLASVPFNLPGQALGHDLTQTVDTTAATTQDDLFNPNGDGRPLGGDGPENLTCRGTRFDKTVWYDFHPKVDGGVEITASGFDAVVTVYEWNPRNSKITKKIACRDTTGTTERLDLPRNVEAGKSYTIQIGRVAGPEKIATGLLTVGLDFFADTDDDGVLDEEPDKCPTTPGLSRFGGCPPELNIAPSLNFDDAPGGISINRLVVARVPKGAKVTGRCGGCPTQTVRARRAGTVTLNKLVGHHVRAGSKVQLRVTMRRTGRGKYKYGATGKLITWPVLNGGIGTKKERCLHVGSGRVEKCS